MHVEQDSFMKRLSYFISKLLYILMIPSNLRDWVSLACILAKSIFAIACVGAATAIHLLDGTEIWPYH